MALALTGCLWLGSSRTCEGEEGGDYRPWPPPAVLFRCSRGCVSRGCRFAHAAARYVAQASASSTLAGSITTIEPADDFEGACFRA